MILFALQSSTRHSQILSTLSFEQLAMRRNETTCLFHSSFAAVKNMRDKEESNSR